MSEWSEWVYEVMMWGGLDYMDGWVGWSDELDGWLVYWLTDVLIDWMTDWLNDWMTEWLNDWMTEWLNDWMTERKGKRDNLLKNGFFNIEDEDKWYQIEEMCRHLLFTRIFSLYIYTDIQNYV